jgi:hypothetical protein
MRKLAKIVLLSVAFIQTMSGQSSHVLRVNGLVVQQNYCYGDDDVFTVPLELKIVITNVSKRAYHITSDLAPVAGRVAVNVAEAQRGHYIAEWNPTRYPKDENKNHPTVSIGPGHSTLLHIGYAVVARFNASPSIPGTVPPGRYVLQLDLRTEKGFAEGSIEDDAKGRIVSLKTEPISFWIPAKVNPTECKPANTSFQNGQKKGDPRPSRP